MIKIKLKRIVSRAHRKSTAKIDKMVKFNRYQKAGVKEYWIVDPAHETIEVYILEDHHYRRAGIHANDEIIHVNSFDDLSIDLQNIFREHF